MTGYLAFDRERLSQLLVSLRSALDEFADWRSGDAEAADAGDFCRRAADRLDRWPGRIASVAECGAMTDLFAWGPTAAPPGFTLVVDSLEPRSPADRQLLVDVLLTELRSGDPNRIPSARLAADLLTLAADPRSAAALAAGLGPDRVVELVDRLVTGAAIDPTAPLGQRGALDVVSILRSLGAAIGPLLATDPGPWRTVVTTADPLAAAVVLAGAADGPQGLPPDELGSLAAALIERLAARQTLDPGWRAATATVMHAAAGDSHAARTLIVDLDADALDAVLFRVDPSAAGRLLLASSNPVTLRPDEVEDPMLRVLDATQRYEARRSGRSPDVGPFPDPLDASTVEQIAVGGTAWEPALDVLPEGFGGYLGRYLPYLVEPPLAAWAPTGAVPWDLSGHDDSLTQTLVAAMHDDIEAAALRQLAQQYVAASSSGSPASQQQAAYIVGGIESAARSAGYDAIVQRQEELATYASIVEFPLNFVPTVASVPAGRSIDAIFDAVAPDLRTAFATGAAAGVGVATTAAYGWLVGWRAVNAPTSTPLPPLPEVGAGSVAPGDRGDAGSGDVADLVREWATANLPPGEADTLLQQYDDIRGAAQDGAALVA